MFFCLGMKYEMSNMPDLYVHSCILPLISYSTNAVLRNISPYILNPMVGVRRLGLLFESSTYSWNGLLAWSILSVHSCFGNDYFRRWTKFFARCGLVKMLSAHISCLLRVVCLRRCQGVPSGCFAFACLLRVVRSRCPWPCEVCLRCCHGCLLRVVCCARFVCFVMSDYTRHIFKVILLHYEPTWQPLTTKRTKTNPETARQPTTNSEQPLNCKYDKKLSD